VKTTKKKKGEEDISSKPKGDQYTSGESGDDRRDVFKNFGPLEKKLWIEQLWRRVISKSRAAALIVKTMNDLNKEIYLYGTKKGAYNSDDELLIHKHKPLFFVLMPNSKIKTVWNVVMTLLLIYTATFVPY